MKETLEARIGRRMAAAALAENERAVRRDSPGGRRGAPTTPRVGTRDAILRILRRAGPCSVKDLSAELGLSGGSISQHLHEMQGARIVRRVRRKREARTWYVWSLRDD